MLFGFKDTNKYLFHINEDIKLFEYSDAGYCMDDVYETDVNSYFVENYSYAYEYVDNTSWLVKIHVKKEMDNVSIIPKLISLKGKYNPSNIRDINTFNQVMLYMKKPNEYPEELYDNELYQIEIVNKKSLQVKLNKLYKEEEDIETNEYVDPNYSLDKYF